MVLLGGITEDDSDASSNQGNENSEEEVHDHDFVENLFERAHLEDVLAQVHDQFGFCTSIYDHSNNVIRIFNIGPTMQKLIQIEVHLELWLIGKASLQTTLEVVKLFDGGDARDRQVYFALVSFGANNAIEVFAERFVRKLGL